MNIWGLFLTFRVPLLTISFRFGFSSRMIFLMWCVCGGFLLHMLESNYLTMLLKTNYEKPVDSAEDVLDRGLKVISGPGVESMVEMLKNSPLPLIRAFAERTVVPKVTFSNPTPLSNSYSVISPHSWLPKKDPKRASSQLWTRGQEPPTHSKLVQFLAEE